MERHEVFAGDEHLHLPQQLARIGAGVASAVEHEEHVAVVAVELRALAEMQRVLERQRVKAEQRAQLLELLGAGRRQIEPEEVIAGEVVGDLVLLDRAKARHREAEPRLGRAIGVLCLGLPDSHRPSVWDASDVIVADYPTASSRQRPRGARGPRDHRGRADPLLGVTFVLAAAISLGASWRLVVSLERVGARLGLSEALLGMLAALAADAPEITASITALAHHDQRIGAGVVIGSNVFNLAALIGLAARHRRAHRAAPPRDRAGRRGRAVDRRGDARDGHRRALAARRAGARARRARALRDDPRHRPRASWPACICPPRGARWLIEAVSEEELELEPAIHPRRGGTRDALIAAGAVVVVVSASVAMERSASQLGARHAGRRRSSIGALVLAGVTSLPNAVAAMYLARRGAGRPC